MKNNRRDFIKYSGIAATALVGAALPRLAVADDSNSKPFNAIKTSQGFNMHGYAAPKIDKVRIGYIGLGSRGSEAVPRILNIEGVEVRALCDTKPKQVELAKEALKGTSNNPALYSGTDHEWKKLCERSDIDLVYICTPWNWHAQMAIYAMEHGKHVAVEVPAAQTIDECWQMVETSEKTKLHCVMLENECYDFFELLTLNMARQGFFGEVLHGEGARDRVGHRGEQTAGLLHPVVGVCLPSGVVGDPDRDRLWKIVTKYNKSYNEYQKKTRRPIPIVRLTPKA